MSATATAVAAGLAFVDALDGARLEERAPALRRLVALDATWWVDSGRDRLAGRHGQDPGERRSWPLHGTMPMEEKLALVERIGRSAFPQGLGRRVATRAFGDEMHAFVEMAGDGLHSSGKRYRNRYALVFEVDEQGLVRTVREYLDTLHAEGVFGASPASRRTAPVPPPATELKPQSRPEELALSLWPALVAGDLDAFGALFAPGATWWTDTGTDRERGELDGDGGRPRSWPFHGVVPMDEKLDYMRARAADGYGSAIAVHPSRCFSQGGLVAVEAESHAQLANGLLYGNRYAFVLDIGPDGIRQVREYCDTLHIADVMGLDTTPDGGSAA